MFARVVFSSQRTPDSTSNRTEGPWGTAANVMTGNSQLDTPAFSARGLQ